jgi:4-aminobutyrate aminotransferase-like enzyme
MTMPETGMVNAFVPGRAALTRTEEALIARRRTLLGPSYRLFYERPVHVVRGEGVWLYDAAGDAYLDVYNNVASVGHCHPRVVEAMTRQAAVLATNTRYLHDSILDYAERLLATFPAALGHVMFTCTGSESNDLAIRIAKAFTGGTGVIVTDNAYHGVSDVVSRFSPSLGSGVDLGPNVRTVRAPDGYRLQGGDVGATFAADVARAASDLRRHGIQPAALIVDTIFSSDGVFADPPGFLAGAVEAIRVAGGLFIADEVQPGFGRTGDGMWGFARHGVEPDIVTLGKPMGNGYPVAGVVLKPDLVADFGTKARYFNTFGGNTVAAATAMAVLDVIEDEGLVENARTVGAYFRTSLDQLRNRFECLGDVRSAGLFLSVEIVSDKKTRRPDSETTTRIVNRLRDEKVLISATGPRANALKIRPPLVFTRDNTDFFIDRFEHVLGTLV